MDDDDDTLVLTPEEKEKLVEDLPKDILDDDEGDD